MFVPALLHDARTVFYEIWMMQKSSRLLKQYFWQVGGSFKASCR